jgi:hypothetical protein
VVGLSSCEVEYIAASTASTQTLWLVQLLGDLLGTDTGAVELWVDSKSVLALTKNTIFMNGAKLIIKSLRLIIRAVNSYYFCYLRNFMLPLRLVLVEFD